MKKATGLVFLILAGCAGLDPLSVAKKATGTSDYHSGSDCQQTYNEVSFLENHTARALNLTVGYPDYSSQSYGRISTVAVQIPAGGTWTQVLTTYQETKYGSFNSDGNQDDAICSATPQNKLVDATPVDGTATVRRCRVKEGAAYLVLPTDTCPAYTSE